MVKKNYCVPYSAAVVRRFATGELMLDFRKVVTLSAAIYGQVIIESCTIDHQKLLVVVMRIFNIIRAKTCHYSFYFVTL